MNMEHVKQSEKGVERIEPIKLLTAEDIKPIIPKKDGTVIVMQCNVQDYRGAEPGPVGIGKLTPESVEQERAIASKYFEGIIAQTPEAEKKDLVFMFVAADTKLLTETGMQNDSKRGVETANLAMEEARRLLTERGLDEAQIMNKNGKSFEISQLQDLKFLRESPDFAQHLRDKYGTGLKFWLAFEEMFEESKRAELGAEGPEQIADRVKNYLSVLANGMKKWHDKNPGKRVIVWTVSHRDNMGPYMKQEMNKTGQSLPKEDYLSIKKGGGFAISVAPDGKSATSDIQHRHFDIKL